MDWQAAKFVLDAAALIISLGSWVYAWTVKRSQARHVEIEQLKAANETLRRAIEAERDRRRQDLAELAQRITRAEGRLDDAPTGKALHELALSISTLAGDIKIAFERLNGLGEVVKRLETIANRQEDFLLNMRNK